MPQLRATESRDGGGRVNRVYTCSLCGLSAPWGETWRWKIAETFTNGVRRLLTICSPECKGTSPAQLAHLARIQPLATAAMRVIRGRSS